MIKYLKPASILLFGISIFNSITGEAYVNPDKKKKITTQSCYNRDGVLISLGNTCTSGGDDCLSNPCTAN